MSTVYSAEDLASVEKIVAWLGEHEKTRSWLGKKTNMASATVSQVLGGKYPSPPGRQIREMLQAIAVESDRMSDGTPGYVKGGVHKLVTVVCDRTRKHASFGLVIGRVGVGKSRTLKEYRDTHPQTALIKVSPNMTAGNMLRALLRLLNTPVPSSLNDKFDAVLATLEGRNFLILVDEADLMSGLGLEYLRRIRDEAQVGVVLAGTEKLLTMIQPENGQFNQIRSRVTMWPATITAISRDDADDMAREALSAYGELSEEVLETLWSYGTGSARVLMEGLACAIRDYLPAEKGLTPAQIKQVAAKVLFMADPGARKGAA